AAAPYLVLGSVLGGLSELLQRLMGLQLKRRQLGPGEGWGAGLLKYEVVCSRLGLLGTLYLDLVARPGKVPSSGMLYPVKCGRELPGGGYQQPVLCLVGNLASSNSSSSSDLSGLPLSWREFKTLLHEMGHATHSMVSRTKYQHVWGTSAVKMLWCLPACQVLSRCCGACLRVRCSQDIVEVPSHLWEHFATDSRSLALLARHADTRQPLPPQLARQLAGLSSATPALELQQQALLSLVDLVYHGPQLPSEAGGTSSVWSSLASKQGSFLPPPGTCPQARFSHLTIYGASYYSYLYARCLSEALWETHLAADPLDATAGHNIRQLLLEPGGALEPLDLLTAALGGLACREHVLHQRHKGWCPNPQSLLRSVEKGVALVKPDSMSSAAGASGLQPTKATAMLAVQWCVVALKTNIQLLHSSSYKAAMFGLSNITWLPAFAPDDSARAIS
ncbi:peptidase family M3-domain-containing protein, partial [Scenedesmus sp. NREL 46B-D3]